MNPTDLLQIAQSLVDKFDTLLEQWIDELTDEQVDEVIWSQENMMMLLDSMIVIKKLNAQRRLKAEKEEKKADKLIYRLMVRTWLDTHDSPDWKITKSVQRKFDVPDVSALPDDCKMMSWGTIHSRVAKWEDVPWVIVDRWYDKYSVR